MCYLASKHTCITFRGLDVIVTQGLLTGGVWHELMLILRCQTLDQVRFSRMGEDQVPLLVLVCFLSPGVRSVSGICLLPREVVSLSLSGHLSRLPSQRGQDGGSYLAAPGGEWRPLRARALNLKSVDSSWGPTIP